MDENLHYKRLDNFVDRTEKKNVHKVCGVRRRRKKVRLVARGYVLGIFFWLCTILIGAK